jgi:S1-C subfamily serine protease
MKMYITLALAMMLVQSAYASQQPSGARADSAVRRVVVEGDIVDIPELASLFVGAYGTVVVDRVMDPSMRPKGNERIDIQEGDVLLMVSGRRVKSLADFRALYEEAKPGSELKLGVERNHAMLIIPFVKGDPEAMPKRRVVIRNGPDGGDKDFLGIPGVGLIVGEKGIVRFGNTFPEASGHITGELPSEGDVIASINGTKASSFSEFAGIYRALSTGAKVTLGIQHGNSARTISFTKPDDAGKLIINRKNGR